MKKAVTFAMAALMATAAWNTLPVKAAGGKQVTIVCKEAAVDWTEIFESCGLPGNCQEWGAIFWQGSCPEWPDLIPGNPGTPDAPETPDTPEIPDKPDETPEVPETPDETPDTPETPDKPETPDETPDKPGTPNVPETPTIPNEPEVPETPNETPNKPGAPDAGSTYAQQVVNLVNIERQKEGLSPLTIDEKLSAAADIRAKEIQTSFSHTRPNGSSFSTALKEAGAVYRRSGENIAWGQKSPEEVVKAWMNSAGHRANIMNKNYSRIGVSHVKNAAGTSYWAQLFAD